LVHGEVHDENAFGLGGVAPHAGLFATARSLGAFAQMMLNGGAYGGRRLLNPGTIARFTRRANLVEGSSRALGWDTPSEPSAAGALFSKSSYGHTGFTGTSLWIDPKRELFAILLTNRVHPTRENSRITELRPAFHDAVMQAIADIEVKPRVRTEN
jgi:CubicO group peptidase (beta-lactamase class C family)